MEALYFFKFWKPNPSHKREDIQTFSSTGPSSTMFFKNTKPGGGGDQLEEGDDSFFELELAFHEPSSDSISKRKILPIEPSSKPHSPISLLKSAPSFKVLTFNKSKSTARRELLEDEVEDDWKLGKYLKLIYRPLNAKKEKKVTTTKRGIMGYSRSPSSSPLTVDSSPRTKLGKGKSSPVLTAPTGRRDDSLALYHDGIQGAILHCKKSFNSSRDPSLLSRFACEESPRSSSDVN